MSSEIFVSLIELSNPGHSLYTCYIQEILAPLGLLSISVHSSLTITHLRVQHTKSFSVRTITETLESVGFNVNHIKTEQSRPESGARNLFQEYDGGVDDCIGNMTDNVRDAKPLLKHMDNSEAYQYNASESSMSHISTVSMMNIKEQSTPPIKEKYTTPPEVVVEPLDQQINDLWRASLAVSGMTCASCVSALRDALERKFWIKKITVNLISNSVVIDFLGETHTQEIIGIIKEVGFEAAIDSVIQPHALATVTRPWTGPRTVEVFVNGMVCDRCSSRIIKSLHNLDRILGIEKPIRHKKPVLKITYSPKIPSFTVRDILAAIENIDPSFTPSIYHPQTLEERSRKLHAREQHRILIRAILNLAIAIPTFIVGIVYMSLVPKENPIQIYLMGSFKGGVGRAQWALFIMATLVYFFCADVFHKRALKEIRASWRPGSTKPILQRLCRFGSMYMLISSGTSIAYISSLAQLVVDEVHQLTNTNNALFYFDSVVFLTLFLLIGRLIEMYTKSKTGDAVMMLGKLRPTKTTLVEFNKNELHGSSQGKKEILRVINTDLLEYGDVVKVLHGESPPCDGKILFGQSRFDESSLTGESLLIKKRIGDDVYSGTLNKGSPVLVEVTGIANSSMLDQILGAVREGQTRRAPVELIADRLTGVFVPIITLIAVITWLFWLVMAISGSLPDGYVGSKPGEQVLWSLQFAISVFVVACPCGLALAAPTALFVGGGIAAGHGILAKGGGEGFEKASKLDAVVFDKTGTLTLGGKPEVIDLKILTQFDGETESERFVLGIVRAVELNSNHPVAKAIVSFCQGKELEEQKVDALEEIPGKGAKGFVITANEQQKVEILVGNELLLLDHEITIDDGTQYTLERWKTDGKSVALVALKIQRELHWKLAAIFSVSDPIRPEASSVIETLKNRGVGVWMLSGDNKTTANAVGLQVGIPTNNIIAGVLPTQKAEKIQYLQRTLKARDGQNEYTQKRALIAMVGDGINDSPALTTADVGIAIGSGSDIAISSADFVLMSSNLKTLVTLLELSQVVFRRIKYNFGWALIYNMVALPIAAGVLYPIVQSGAHVRLDPVWASLAMATSSISVICSSLLLRSRIPGIGFRIPSQKMSSGRVGKEKFKLPCR
ncbi:putative copper-transporting ATPase [Podosphaera aphanis]|nr:putative copper-transporting ATPase [Podosphaera aphanis]